MKNNGEDMRSSENKVSHECETIRGKVLIIRNRIEDFSKKKKKHMEGWEWREESKGEKRKVCRKIRETPIFLCKTK